MADLNKESMAIWKSLKPMIDEEIKAQTRGSVQRRKMKVTTAPSLVTNVIGVTEPYGSEMFIPFNTNLSAAHIGDVVWVEFMYGATNAFASMYASADTKDWTVGGDANIMGNATINGSLDVTNRRCEATLSSVGWYRAIIYNAYDNYSALGYSGEIVTIRIVYTSGVSCQHIIKLFMSYNKIVFLGEETSGTTNVLDKIRYTVNGSKGYVDIHWTSTTACQVNVSYEVASRNYAQANWVAGTLSSVADAPTGETVLTTYDFSANGTGDITCNGVLDVTPRRCSATLSSAGWYRVLDVSPLTSAMAQGALGESIRFDISRRGSSVDAETHTIVYRAVNGGKGGFTDESSKGGSLLIDKIRYTRTSTSAHIDIHYNSSGSNGVTVYFDVNVVPDSQNRFTANSLTSVANAPSGETVVTTYTFAADCTQEARVLLWNNWNTRDVSPQTINMDLSGYKFIEVLFDPFAALGKIQCQRCLVGPSSSSAYTATLQYYFLRTDATGTASVTAVSRDIDVYSSGIVIGNGQMLYNNTKYNDWPSRCRPIQIWGIR